MASENNILNNYETLIQEINSLNQMDTFVEQVSEAMYSAYSCISCKTGCNTCCTGASFPVVYPKEWQRIRKYIISMTDKNKDIIYNNANKINKEFYFFFSFLHENIDKPIIPELFELINEVLLDQACPLLIDGRSSVYSVRLTGCRTFGSFYKKNNNEIYPLTCKSDFLKLQNYLSENEVKELELPLENKINEKLSTFALNISEKYHKTIIPLWLSGDLFNSIPVPEETPEDEHNKPEIQNKNIIYLINQVFSLTLKDIETANYDRAEKILKILIKLASKPVYFYHLGNIQLIKMDYNESSKTFSRYLKTGDNDFNAFKNMTICLEKLGDQKTAASFTNKSILFENKMDG